MARICIRKTPVSKQTKKKYIYEKTVGLKRKNWSVITLRVVYAREELWRLSRRAFGWGTINHVGISNGGSSLFPKKPSRNEWWFCTDYLLWVLFCNGAFFSVTLVLDLGFCIRLMMVNFFNEILIWLLIIILNGFNSENFWTDFIEYRLLNLNILFRLHYKSQCLKKMSTN